MWSYQRTGVVGDCVWERVWVCMFVVMVVMVVMVVNQNIWMQMMWLRTAKIKIKVKQVMHLF